MSYCRLSSDSYRSDVYVYKTGSEDDPVITIHVAARHPIYPANAEAPPFHLLANDPEAFAAEMETWRIRRDAVVMVPLAHPSAGQSLYFEPGAAAEWLRQAAKDGLHIPEGVAEEIEEDHLPLLP